MRLIKKYKTELKNDYKFYLSDDYLCFKQDDSIVILNNDLSLYEKIRFNKKVARLQIINDEILIICYANHPYLYRLKGNVENLISVQEDENLVSLGLHETFDKFLMEKSKGSPFLYDTGIYYRESNNVVYFNDEFNPNIIINNKIICKGNDAIKLYDEKEGTRLWQFSVSDFPSYLEDSYRQQKAEIKQVVGLYNNILWIFVGGWHLVGLNINTGEKIHHIENIQDLLGLDDAERRAVNFLDTMHLDQKSGILKAFAFRFYFEIDLNTLQGKVKKDFGPKWNPDWRIRRSTFYQEYPDSLFFCGYYKELDRPNAFGIFDTVKGEITWFDTTKDNLGNFYNPPQANDKLLTILDDEGNLLVYDREETNG